MRRYTGNLSTTGEHAQRCREASALRHPLTSTSCNLRTSTRMRFDRTTNCTKTKFLDRRSAARVPRGRTGVWIIRPRASARLEHMQDETSSVASDANTTVDLPQATQALPTSYDHDVPAAAQAPHESLPAALDYTLTVGQAQQRFADLKRHVPKDRTIQNYCQQGDIAAQKIRTTFGSEWIINAQSLEAFILREPEMPSAASAARVAGVVPHAAQTLETSKDIPTADPPQKRRKRRFG